jgi:rRNA maturation RNase YbeY
LGTVTFNNHNIKLKLKNKLLIKSFIARIFAEEEVTFRSVSYIFCTDEFLLKLNQEYLKHNTLTDILTFTLSNTSLPIVSEIYISIERVSENAKQLQIPFLTELYRVMIHGILHLCGYPDHTTEEKRKMRQKEDYYLALL